MVTRTELAVAGACTAWAAAFLAGEGTAVAFAPALGLAVLGYRRRPLHAGLATAGVVLALHLSGVSEENPATLAAVFTTTHSLGRHGSLAAGAAAVLALAAALTVVDGLAPADAVFVLFVLGVTWASGRLVRRRSERTRADAAIAAALAARDPATLATRVVAEERARLAGDALAITRRAVASMLRHAAAAESDLDPVALDAVQARGREAVAELRRLLGLLRAAPEPAGEAGGRQATAGRPGARRRHHHHRPPRWVLVASALLAACAIDVASPGPETGAASVALTLVFAATAALAPFRAAVACLAATLPPLAALALDAPLIYGFSSVVALGLLAWWAGADPRWTGLVSLGVLTSVALAGVHAHSPGNEAILLAIVAVAALAGRGWGRREREGAAAIAAADRLRAEHDAAAERAVRAERLRLARELHDVTSHAVGTMVLQAGAALATRERDPATARAALREVQRSGTEALAELEQLFGLLDAGAVGAPGLAAQAAERDLPDALAALAGRMRGGGLHVDVRLPERLPQDPASTATVYRIVQEALTNAARHAPGSRVEVDVTTDGPWLEVDVRDDGARARRGAGVAEGAGFGLIGLAERVRMLGGELSAGPGAGGGFVVAARLPARQPEEARA